MRLARAFAEPSFAALAHVSQLPADTARAGDDFKVYVSTPHLSQAYIQDTGWPHLDLACESERTCYCQLKTACGAAATAIAALYSLREDSWGQPP